MKTGLIILLVPYYIHSKKNLANVLSLILKVFAVPHISRFMV